MRLMATFAAPDQSAKAGRVVLPGNEPLPLRIRPVDRSAPSLSLLSFRLPKATPPGHYTGSLELGESQIPIEVDVEARQQLRFLPSRVSFEAAPGARLKTEVTVVNLGNVGATILPESTFCVFDGKGINQAFFVALTEEFRDGKQRIDRAMDEISRSHGGLVRAVVEEGAGELAPETARNLVVEFHFSHRMVSGRTYRGAWSIAEASLEVQVEATNTVDGGKA